MVCHTEKLIDKGLIKNYPRFLKSNIQYEVIMGSEAYGCSSNNSDFDIYGFCIPKKNEIFRHLDGEIEGFSKPKKRFKQFICPHVFDKDALGGNGREYDITIYNIVKYFRLCADNNPNMIDSLFVPYRCITFSSTVGNMVREKRHLFLSKKYYHTTKGYSYQQLHKAKGKNPQKGSKRYELRQVHGFDSKFLYHVVRLLSQCEQALVDCDIDLERDKEYYKAIRRGEVGPDDVYKLFQEKEKQLEKLYESSKLQYSVDEEKIKQLLIDCLEHHYGSLEDCVVQPDTALKTLEEINEKIDKVLKQQRINNIRV